MADDKSKIEEKHVCFDHIFDDFSSENLPKLSKERLQYCCNSLKFKVSGEKKDLVQRLEPPGKFKGLFDKKVARIQEDYKFSTVLDPLSIPPLSANWKVIGMDAEVAVPIVTENTIKELIRKPSMLEGKDSIERLTDYFLQEESRLWKLSVKWIF